MPGGAPAGRIAIKAEDNFVRLAEKLLHMDGRGRRTQCGHGKFYFVLGQGHDIHIPLDNHRVPLGPDCASRLRKAVKLPAFFE